MGKLSKLAILLYAVLLSVVSIGTANYEPFSPYQETTNGRSSFFSEGSQSPFCLFSSAEQLVHPVSNYPIPHSKIHSNSFAGGSFSFEVRIQGVASQYLLHAKEIYPSLSIRELLFPFHHFL